ncbi:MAG TPA: tRNA lysidine(34) synthetase [Mycobacteriales bacterium]|nr:tRNA lysidine(34) synthetase [Mycobacteriales bacterium]
MTELRPAGVLVACSGGPDSVALAAATAFEAPRLGIPAGLVTVDHGLQDGSADWAAETASLGRALGLDPVLVRRVTVGIDGGPEAAARTARYAALADAAGAAAGAVTPAPGTARSAGAGVGAGPAPAGVPYPGWVVVLGHTLDDQAETVLLGLGRGSGPRSIAGMRPVDGRWVRPLLGVRRAATREACVAERLAYRDDPHNADPRFTRVRLRTEVLPLLEDILQGGTAEALARTAGLLRDDLDALDALAAALTPDGPVLDPDALARHPRAVRTRVLRAWAGGPLTAVQLRALDALVTDWHGQGPVSLPSGRVVSRSSGMLRLDRSS